MHQEILDDLYERFYLNFQNHSEVTSSHWKKVGKQIVLRENNNYKIKGYGFGNFMPDNVLRKMRFAPEIYLSLKLLKNFKVSKNIQEAAKKVAKQSGRLFEFDCAKQTLAVNDLLKQLNRQKKSDKLQAAHPPESSQSSKLKNFSEMGIKNICIIGDGYGYFANLLKTLDSKINVLSVNLGRTLFFDVFFSKLCFPTTHSILLKNETVPETVFDRHSITFLEAENYHLLEKIPIDLFVNIASMQEMNPDIIANYFNFMRMSSASEVFFYCCNRLEKKLPDGTLVRFAEYPWGSCEILFDELCPWYQKFPVSNPPFWRSFDGPTQHRLVKLK